MPSLRAHEHERFVRRDSEEPRREARVATERPHASNDLHERGLKKVPTIVFGDRIALELLLDVRSEVLHEPAERFGVPFCCAAQSRLFD